MLACTDVTYTETTARVACVTFKRWTDAGESSESVLDVPGVEPYVPGQFYRRELPCLLSVLEQFPARPDTVVVDGYVWLDDQDWKGLGAHLFDVLGESVPIIGVAKTHFATANNAIEVFRGESERPLFVTAAGMDQGGAAADCMQRMHGENRISTLLKQVDRLSRIPDRSN